MTDLDRLLDEAAAALEDGDLAQAKVLSERILLEEPECVPAIHFVAVAERGLGELEAAEARFERALEMAPDDVDVMFSAASLYIEELGAEPELAERGLELCAGAVRIARKLKDDDLLHE